MPRQTIDILTGYQFAVRSQQIARVDPKDGLPYHDANGTPQHDDITVIVLDDPTTGHQVQLPLTDDARRELARQLAGGIVLAAAPGP